MRIGLAAIAALMLVPSAAMAVDYPAPKDPGKLPPRANGEKATLHVCKKDPDCFHSIQKAVNASRGGDTIKVANGTYKEGVLIQNKGRHDLRIIGNKKKPQKVVLNGKSLKGADAQNAFFVNHVNDVTIRGFKAKNYKANGVFLSKVTGYLLKNLIAEHTGRYGLYAFDSKGGTMAKSEAYEESDSGFYVGQTPPQTKPKRTFLKNLKSHTNVLGYSGTNMRYVTIQDSQFWNNGIGIVPNALDSEDFAPPEFNVIKDNEIFWNNFNYYLGAPFPVTGDEQQTDVFAFPVGLGILLFGGRDTLVEGNKIYGNYAGGYAMIDQLALEDVDARTVDRNTIRGNEFGFGGMDLNGRDIVYDGSGSDNCFADNGDTQNNLPADDSELAPCPFSGSNGVNDEARQQMLQISLDEDREKYWVKHPHADKPGYAPLEHYGG